MKVKFKLLMLLVAVLPLCSFAAEYEKTVHQGYAKDQIMALDISNKFGMIEINDLGGDSVTVDVRITVESRSEATAEQLLDYIEINLYQSGNTLNAQTVIKDDFKSKQNFSIDYRINIPNDRALKVTNKFGNVAVQSLEAAGSFTIGYGNITTGTLNAPGNGVNLELAYGKADIESVNKLISEVKYSKLYLGTVGDMVVESKYCDLNIDNIHSLQIASKYDGVSLGVVDAVSADSKYTNYDIDELKSTLKIDTQYGSVRVGDVSPAFESINITNSYGGISLGMSDLSYYLDARCDYCDVKYPETEFHGNREKDNSRLSVVGQVGDATGAPKVVIQSRYGGVNLQK